MGEAKRRKGFDPNYGQVNKKYKNNSDSSFGPGGPTEEEIEFFIRRVLELIASFTEPELEIEQMLYPGDSIWLSEAASSVVKAMDANERTALEQDMKYYLVLLVDQLDQGMSCTYNFKDKLEFSYIVKQNFLIYKK